MLWKGWLPSASSCANCAHLGGGSHRINLVTESPVDVGCVGFWRIRGLGVCRLGGWPEGRMSWCFALEVVCLNASDFICKVRFCPTGGHINIGAILGPVEG